MGDMQFKRALVDTIVDRMAEPRKFIQIVIGPRRTGKTVSIATCWGAFFLE